MPRLDEREAREVLSRKLLACLGSPREGHSREVLELAAHAAQALWLRDERLANLEAWLDEYREGERRREQDLLDRHPEDVERLRKIILARFGAMPTKRTILDFWRAASEQVSASWLSLASLSDEDICALFARSPFGLSYAAEQAVEKGGEL